jgi:hypothetical protein
MVKMGNSQVKRIIGACIVGVLSLLPAELIIGYSEAAQDLFPMDVGEGEPSEPLIRSMGTAAWQAAVRQCNVDGEATVIYDTEVRRVWTLPPSTARVTWEFAGDKTERVWFEPASRVDVRNGILGKGTYQVCYEFKRRFEAGRFGPWEEMMTCTTVRLQKSGHRWIAEMSPPINAGDAYDGPWRVVAALSCPAAASMPMPAAPGAAVGDIQAVIDEAMDSVRRLAGSSGEESHVSGHQPGVVGKFTLRELAGALGYHEALSFEETLKRKEGYTYDLVDVDDDGEQELVTFGIGKQCSRGGGPLTLLRRTAAGVVDLWRDNTCEASKMSLHVLSSTSSTYSRIVYKMVLPSTGTKGETRRAMLLKWNGSAYVGREITLEKYHRLRQGYRDSIRFPHGYQEKELGDEL